VPLPIEFVLFALVLAGVALLHRHALTVAVSGLMVIGAVEVAQGTDLVEHLVHEWVPLANLLGLLLGFALLADHFERSHLPQVLPRWLPDDAKGGFALLALVFVLSSFLDNIAGAMIGGTIARSVFKGRVHMGFLAAIVAASNAGGSGSVVGDTTTTMMWIAGIPPLDVVAAYAAAVPALLVFGSIAAVQQHRLQPIIKDEIAGTHVDLGRIAIVAVLLVAAVGTNVVVNVAFPHLADRAPWIAIALWVALLATAGVRRPGFSLLPESAKGAAFLLSLVLCASMMPVSELPAPTAWTTLGLGFLSAVFDNIPLTALALKQGGYDWAALAFAVGYGGSMVWFGSSSGVALTNEYPEGRNAVAWLRHGWHVALAYVVGFAVWAALLGWNPGT
jgi:Na+/H+ antiporter NhaD/arsenite permease-like protein